MPAVPSGPVSTTVPPLLPPKPETTAGAPKVITPAMFRSTPSMVTEPPARPAAAVPAVSAPP